MARPKRDKPEFYLKLYRGKYYIHWSEKRRTKRVSSGTANEEQAERFRQEFAEAYLSPAEDEKGKVKVIIEGYKDYKKQDVKSKGQPTRNYDAIIFALKPIEKEFGNLYYDEITRPKIRSYIYNKQKAEYSNATIKKSLDIFAAALNHAEKDGWIIKAPHIEKPTPPIARQAWMNEKQVKIWLNNCKTPHVKLFALLALHTLSRKTAILELTWDRVDLDKMRIDFNKPGMLPTKKRRVDAPIESGELYNALEEAREAAQSNYVIEYKDKGIADIDKAFNRVSNLDAVDMDWVTTSVMRHTGATLLSSKGVSLHKIAALMNDTYQTVEKNYAKFHPDHLQDAVKELGEMYG